LGEARLRTGRLAEAIPCFERSSAIHPGYANNWSLWLSGLTELERWDEVPRVAAGLEMLRPDDVILAYARARLHLRAGQFPEAAAVADAASLQHPGYPALVQVQAEAAEGAGDDDRAIDLYTRLLETPFADEARGRLAFLLLQNERWEEAERQYDHRYRSRGDWYSANALAWSKRGRALAEPEPSQRGELLREALSLTAEAARMAQPPNQRFVEDTRAKILESMGDIAGAMEIYRALAGSHPDEPQYRDELNRLGRRKP
jgi:tetratricopeptide (TPR) repeat protein